MYCPHISLVTWRERPNSLKQYHYPEISAIPCFSFSSGLHFQTRKVLDCKLIEQKNSFRVTNLKTTLNSKRCWPRIYAIEEGAADVPSFDHMLDSGEMSGGCSSRADEELEQEIATSHAGDSEPMHNANHSEDTVKDVLSPFRDMPIFYQARFLLGLLMTAGLSFLIIVILLFVDWRIIRVPLASFSLTFPFLGAAIITGILGCFCVPLLTELKFEQILRKEGPASHSTKIGTPTMGGLYFVPVGLIIARLITGCSSPEVSGPVTVTLAFAAIGLLDDSLTFIRNHNYGLPGWLKFSLQVASGICFYFWQDFSNLPSPYQMKTLVPLPPPVGPLYLGKWYLPLTAFCFAAMGNGVNLTDGLDGLAGGTAALAFIGMSIAVLPIYPGLAVFGVSMAGACIGFLIHNRYKASIFMGDTGSLALGGALAAMAAFSGMFFPLFIASGIFVVETISVMMQVFYFKATKRINGSGSRLFLMAPIHHHFELSGVKEPYIIGSAYAISCVLSMCAAYIGFHFSRTIRIA